MSFTKVLNKRRNKKKSKKEKQMNSCTCSRCWDVNNIFPTQELNEAHGNFMFYLEKIVTDQKFKDFINILIDEDIVYHKTLIYNRESRSKQTLNKLVWCKECGIFMEANRYYIEMYLYYMYLLINTNFNEFQQKKENLNNLCNATKKIEELSEAHSYKKRIYTAEMKIIESLQKIVNQMKPDYYVTWNKTFDKLNNSYSVTFGEQFHFKQLDEKIRFVQYKDRFSRFIKFVNNIIGIKTKVDFNEYFKILSQLNEYDEILQQSQQQSKIRENFISDLQLQYRNMDLENKSLREEIQRLSTLNSQLVSDNVLLRKQNEEISTSSRFNNLLDSVPPFLPMKTSNFQDQGFNPPPLRTVSFQPQFNSNNGFSPPPGYNPPLKYNIPLSSPGW